MHQQQQQQLHNSNYDNEKCINFDGKLLKFNFETQKWKENIERENLIFNKSRKKRESIPFFCCLSMRSFISRSKTKFTKDLEQAPKMIFFYREKTRIFFV